MFDFPPTTDLGMVEAEMMRRGVFPEVAAKIRQALVAASCLADLKHAGACLTALQSTPPLDGSATDDVRSCRYALITTATALYARATSTSGSQGERGSVQIASTLTAEQLKDHEAIIAVRNQVVAHVYTNQTIGGADWHDTKAILVEYNGYSTPAVLTRRLFYNEGLNENLERQVPVALAALTERAGQRQREIINAMEKVRGPILDELLLLGKSDFVAVNGGDLAEAIYQAALLRAGVGDPPND